MTALIGLVFGGNSDSGALGRIRFAVVDEDKSVLSDFLRGAANQREGGKYLEPVFLDREDAMRQINANKISAVLIIPTNSCAIISRARPGEPGTDQKSGGIHPSSRAGGIAGRGGDGVERDFAQLPLRFPEWQAVFEGKRIITKSPFD